MIERYFQFSIQLIALLFLLTAAVPVIELIWPGHKVSADKKHLHLGDDLYNQTYAKFTKKFRLLTEKPYKWRGTWSYNPPEPAKDLQPKILKNFFLNRQGQSLVSFHYIEAVKKTIMTVELLDDIYTDSSRLIFDFNLKMSTFDRYTSSFSIDKLQFDEYSVELHRKEKITVFERVNYFNINFKADFRHKASKLPLNLDSGDPRDVLIDFTIRSNTLGLDFSGRVMDLYSESYSYFLYVLLLIFLFVLSCSNCGTLPVMLTTGGFIKNIGIEVQIMMLYTMLCYIKLLETIISGERNPFVPEVSYLLTICFLQYIGELIRVLRMFHFEMDRLQQGAGAEQLYLVCIGSLGYIGFLYLAFILDKIVETNRLLQVLLLLHSFPFVQQLLTLLKAVNRNVYLFEYQGVSWLFVALIGLMSKGVGSFFLNLYPSQPLAIIIVVGWPLINLIMYNQSVRGVYFFLPKACLKSYFPRMLQAGTESSPNLIHPRCKVCELNQVYANAQDPPVRRIDTVARCGHTYHRECLLVVLSISYRCYDPQCNKTILPDSEGF